MNSKCLTCSSYGGINKCLNDSACWKNSCYENRFNSLEDEEINFQYEEDLGVENINDLVNRVAVDVIKPSHYKAGEFDVISFCQIHDIGFELGNIIKYVTRAGKKENNSELQDLIKALEFLNRRIEFVKSKGE